MEEIMKCIKLFLLFFITSYFFCTSSQEFVNDMYFLTRIKNNTDYLLAVTYTPYFSTKENPDTMAKQISIIKPRQEKKYNSEVMIPLRRINDFNNYYMATITVYPTTTQDILEETLAVSDFLSLRIDRQLSPVPGAAHQEARTDMELAHFSDVAQLGSLDEWEQTIQISPQANEYYGIDIKVDGQHLENSQLDVKAVQYKE